MSHRYQVTEFELPDTMISTQWGRLTFDEWLQSEITRWYDKDFRNAWVELNDVGEVAMFTDCEDFRPI